MATKSKNILISDTPMDEKHRDILKNVKVGLVKDMDPEEVLLHMAASHVFSDKDEEEIKAQKTRQEKCQTLLSILPKRGAKAFSSFVGVLEEVHAHLANLVLEAEIKELNKELTTERANSAQLRRRLSVSGNQTCLRCSTLKNECDTIRTEHNKEKQNFEKEKNEMKKTIDNYNNEIEKLKEANAQERKNKNEIEKSKEKLKEDNKNSADLITSLMEEKRNFEMEKENLQKEKRDLASSLKEKTREYDEFVQKAKQDFIEKEEAKTLQEGFIECKNFVSGNQVCSRCHDLKQELDSLKTQMETLQTKIKRNEEEETLEKEKDDSDTKVTGLREANARQKVGSQQEVQIVSLVEEKNDDINLRLREMEKGYKKRIQELKKNEEKMKKKYARENEKSSNEIKTLRKENKKLIGENAKFKAEGNETSEFERVRVERDQLSSKMKQLGKQLSESQLKCEELEEINVTYGNNLRDLKKELDALKTNFVSEQNKIKQLQLQRETLENEKKDRDTKITELEKVNESLSTVRLPIQVRQLEQRIANLEKRKNDLELQLRSEKERVERKLTNKNEERKNPVKDAHVDDDSIRTIKKLKEENKNLKSQIRNKTAVTTELRKQVEKLEEEVLKCGNSVFRFFLPSGKDFSSSPGIVCALKRKGSTTICATRSSDGPGEASDIFDNRIGKTSGTKEEKGSWWCIDLGKNCLLVISHYALRHGKSDGESYLKEWQLQGSVDGDTWKNLETGDDPSDPSPFRDPHPYYTGTWSIKGEVKAFRYFRILQTRRNSSGNYGLYLSGFELYGLLLKM
ncbi:uncharacterized protein LOC144661517 isoform X1 [Oculina patagonica]